MKSNKGITLTVLVIYVICIVFVTGLISSLTSYFYKNSNEVIIKNNSHEQYTKFLSYIAKDLNNSDLQSVDVENNEQNIIKFRFSGEKEHRYSLKNNRIYYENPDTNNLKKIILCENVFPIESEKAFIYENNQLIVGITINGENFSNRFAVKTGN